MGEIEKILQIANNEVGYLEKSKYAYQKDPTVLYDKTRGAGSDNCTKYAKEMDDLNVYNGKKNYYAWCNVFIDWIFYKALGINRATELLIGWNAGCTQDWNWFKSHGQIVSNPQRGDLIFFRNLCHIGIVEKVENGKVYTIEGNTSNAAELITNGGTVAKKVYNIGSSSIYGYARPKYDNSNSTPSQDNNSSNEITYSTIKRGSKGNLVRIAQQKLIVKGYKLPKYGADGSFGAETEQAVRQLQKDAGLTADGIIGKYTWGVLNSDFSRPERSAIYPGYLIRKGQQSEDVRKVQQRLIDLGYSCGAKGADTIFGKDTLKAVKAFQRDNGLSQDGLVGPLTWEKLF